MGADDEAGVTTAMESTTQDSTTESDIETSSETSNGWIVPESDLPSQACDFWAQDCVEGEKCVPYDSGSGSWDAHKCVEIMGDQHEGEPCWSGGQLVATDDCDASSICFYATLVEGELLGTCTTMCSGTAEQPACPMGSECLINGLGVLNLCNPICSPLEQDCGEGLACYWVDPDFSCIFTDKDLADGEPCTLLNDCAAGSLCVAGSALPSCAGESCCTSFCDLQLGDADCADQPGTACVPFFDGQPPPEYDTLGVCTSAP